MRSVLRVGEAETARVEAFSDGVLAIVITLLVLELHVPQVRGGETALWRALGTLLPIIGAWVVNFLFVLVFWVAHHYFFAQLAKVDRGLLWLNGLFLLCICFTPFPAALEAAYPGSRPAAFLLSSAMFLSACSFALMRGYSVFSGHLMKPHVPLRIARQAMRRSLIGPVLYGIGVVAAFFLPRVSLVVQVLVPVIYFLPGRAASKTYSELERR